MGAHQSPDNKCLTTSQTRLTQLTQIASLSSSHRMAPLLSSTTKLNVYRGGH